VERGCRVVSTTDPSSHILSFLDRSRYYFFQVAPQLYPQGWMDPIPDPLLVRKSGSARNLTRTSDHQTTSHMNEYILCVGEGRGGKSNRALTTVNFWLSSIQEPEI
jgi:hypothetical protein